MARVLGATVDVSYQYRHRRAQSGGTFASISGRSARLPLKRMERGLLITPKLTRTWDNASVHVLFFTKAFLCRIVSRTSLVRSSRRGLRLINKASETDRGTPCLSRNLP